jgi:ATP-dependent DNA helicase DinG
MKDFFGPKGLLSQKLDAYEFRPSQLEMAQAVEDALGEGYYLIVEAGTGTGKTLAYLVPAVLAGKKVVVSTGTKNLQEQLFYKDIPFLKSVLPISFEGALMKGRGNYLCVRRLKRFRAQPSLQTPEEVRQCRTIDEWAPQTATGDRSELKGFPDDSFVWSQVCSTTEQCAGQKCEDFSRCFISRLKQRAARADIIIVNHHLLFADLAIKEAGYGAIIPRYEAIVFDEAHQLEEVATHYFGVTVSTYRIEELVRDVRRELSSLKEHDAALDLLLDALLTQGRQLFALLASPKEKYRVRKEMVPQAALTSFPPLCSSLEVLDSKLRPLQAATEDAEVLADRALRLKAELEFLYRMDDPDYVFWCESRGRGVFLHASLIEVGETLASHLYSHVDSTVFTSATLSGGKTFSYFKRRVGLDSYENLSELVLGSPFDYGSQALLYIPRNLPDPKDDDFLPRAVREIEGLLKLSRGRGFVLFTSIEKMRKAHALLVDRLGVTVLLQGEKPKSHILKEFREDTDSVLFATSSFWEGVDVKGEALSCVIIDKLPFARPDEPLVEARIERISREGENPFTTYQVPSAILSLKQGLGRLIRNREDTGVLSILDGRLLTRPYGPLFLEHLPGCPITHDVKEVEGFFAAASC